MLLLLGHDQPLTQACRYFSEQGIPFPSIDLKDDEKNLKECYMFDGADTPGAPLLLYFPLVNDTFQKYVAPGKLTVPIWFHWPNECSHSLDVFSPAPIQKSFVHLFLLENILQKGLTQTIFEIRSNLGHNFKSESWCNSVKEETSSASRGMGTNFFLWSPKVYFIIQNKTYFSDDVFLWWSDLVVNYLSSTWAFYGGPLCFLFVLFNVIGCLFWKLKAIVHELIQSLCNFWASIWGSGFVVTTISKAINILLLPVLYIFIPFTFSMYSTWQPVGWLEHVTV